MPKIAQNLAIINERIRRAAQQCGRNPDDIQLLGVSKTRSAQNIRDAHAVGLYLQNGGIASEFEGIHGV